MKNLSFVIGITLFLFILSSSCGSIKDPDFKGIENIRISRFGLNGSTLNMDLHYYNPNNSRLKLKKAEGDAWLDGNLLGHFIMDTLIKIPANGDFRLPVSLEMNMKKLLQNSTALLLKKEVLFRVEGKVKLGKGGIFINHPVRYEGKQRTDSLMKGINK